MHQCWYDRIHELILPKPHNVIVISISQRSTFSKYDPAREKTDRWKRKTQSTFVFVPRKHSSRWNEGSKMGRGLFLLPEKAHFNSYSSCSDKTTRVRASIERLRFAKQIERCEAAACRDACHAPTANLKVGERRSPSCLLLVCPFHPPFQSVSAWDLSPTCTCPPSPTAWDALPAPSFRGLEDGPPAHPR